MARSFNKFLMRAKSRITGRSFILDNQETVKAKAATKKCPPNENDLEEELDKALEEHEQREPRTKKERRLAGYLVEGDIFKMPDGLCFFDHSAALKAEGLVEFKEGEKETRRFDGYWLVTQAEMTGGDYADNWPDAWHVTAVKLSQKPIVIDDEDVSFGKKGDILPLPNVTVRRKIEFVQGSNCYVHKNPVGTVKAVARAKKAWQLR